MAICRANQLAAAIRSAVIATAVWTATAAAAPALAAPVTAAGPYQVSVFAPLPKGLSQPDSIITWHRSVFVAFENHVAKDGSDGKSSTIVEYSSTGEVRRMFSVKGHNDGLRVVDGNLWAVQNEDANPNLVVINLESGSPVAYKFPPAPHGGGYDDIIVLDDEVYLTASNPTLNAKGINVFPALVRAKLWMDKVVLEPVLAGNATAIDIPSDASVKLNLTDPDSMTKDLNGDIVFVSQADSELIFVKHPGSSAQSVGVLPLELAQPGAAGPLTIDDTAFAPEYAGDLLVTDVSGGIGEGAIYRIKRKHFAFEVGQAYSASDSYGIVGTLDVDNGIVTPVVSGLSSARGLAFLDGHGEQDGDQPMLH